VTDPRQLFQGYARQREELGEGRLVSSAKQWTGGSPVPESLMNTTVDPPIRPSADPPKWLQGAPDIPGPGMTIVSPPKDLFTPDPLGGFDIPRLATHIGDCRLCSLCETRNRTVPGDGSATARLVVVGEGPGATEDETGRPFVGRAGELLTKLLAAIDLSREQVFICNVVKCRPPGNRKPFPDEIASCVPFLYRQIELIQPAVVLAMGGTAAETLLNVKQPLTALRGKVHDFRGIPLVVTYHPAALLRNPHWKKPTWDDVRIARRLLDAR
jgi:DNA polymerase